MPSSSSSLSGRKPFLTARWANLIMLNWEVPEAMLEPHLPRGVELDLFHGRCFASIVAFQFLDTRVLGFGIPGHRAFAEVNLRFYVKRSVNGEERRGVVFISEYVPLFWVAFIARALYNERYSRVPMTMVVNASEEERELDFAWRAGGSWHHLRSNLAGAPEALASGSQEEFIAEHYYGYSRQRNGRTVEYKLEHPSWRVWKDVPVSCEWRPALSYGAAWGVVLSEPPAFSFVAEGSAVSVSHGQVVP
jgi:uncharacterized protein YqjF (DUF2071 family)